MKNKIRDWFTGVKITIFYLKAHLPQNPRYGTIDAICDIRMHTSDMHLVFIDFGKAFNNINRNLLYEQDAHEAMRVFFFSVLTKRICMHITNCFMNIFKYCFKNYIKLHEFANCNSANYAVYFLTIVRLKMYFHRRQTCTKCRSKPKFVTCNLKSELKLLSAIPTQTNIKVRTLCPIFWMNLRSIDWVN